MLNRNCETEKKSLIYPGDFNVRVTVCTPKSKYLQESAYYPAWIETIRDSLGGSIIHSEESKAFSIKRLGRRRPYLATRKGNEIMKCISFLFQKPVSFRLETVEENPKAWVFYLEKDI